MKWNKFQRLGTQKGSFDQIVIDWFDKNDDAYRWVIIFSMSGTICSEIKNCMPSLN